MNNVIDGKETSITIEEEVKQCIKGCIIRPSVAVIQVGDNELSETFIKLKEDACNRVGIYFRYYKFEDGTSELTIINKIKELNNDDYVNGIMIKLPLPEKYNEKRLLNTIINSKDVDGLTDINIGRLLSGRKTIIPSAVLSILTLLKENNIELKGKDVVIVGKGKTVGRPLISVLLNEGATVTICHSNTLDIKRHTLNADIVISATGVKNIITEDMVKENAIVIGVGCCIEKGKILDDIDSKVLEKNSIVIKALDSIVPLTVSMFLKNTLLCYSNKK